jgi:hypothetical protein
MAKSHAALPTHRAPTPINIEPTPAASAPTVSAPKRLKVRAIEVGYYEHRRIRLGDVFVLSDARHFTSRWMERVDAATPEKITTGREALATEHRGIMQRAAGIPTDVDLPPGMDPGVLG